MRRMLIAAGSAIALAAAALPTSVSAAPHGMHMGGGGHFGGHFGGFGGFRGGGFRGHFGGPGFGFGAPYAYAYGSCYSLHRVWTPYGWRWRRFWAC